MLPGQPDSMHVSVSVLEPLHVLPPFKGAGLVHDLDLVHVPLSHVTVHPAHDDQDVQSPLTKCRQSKYI